VVGNDHNLPYLHVSRLRLSGLILQLCLVDHPVPDLRQDLRDRLDPAYRLVLSHRHGPVHRPDREVLLDQPPPGCLSLLQPDQVDQADRDRLVDRQVQLVQEHRHPIFRHGPGFQVVQVLHSVLWVQQGQQDRQGLRDNPVCMSPSSHWNLRLFQGCHPFRVNHRFRVFHRIRGYRVVLVPQCYVECKWLVRQLVEMFSPGSRMIVQHAIDVRNVQFDPNCASMPPFSVDQLDVPFDCIPPRDHWYDDNRSRLRFGVMTEYAACSCTTWAQR